MSEIKKLTPEELESVRTIKQEYSNLSFSLGELELQKNNIEKEKQDLLNQHNKLVEKEVAVAKSLTEKYGTGSINIDTGEITQ